MGQISIDWHTFFTMIRPVFGNLLTTGQVNGMQAIITAWASTSQTDLRWLAYELATAKWETDHTMQPIREYGAGAGHPYGAVDQTGAAPYGRGYVQLTWRANYIAADTKLGLNGALSSNYDLALDPTIAANIMFRGMAEGWFTKHKLGDYINAAGCDYINARQIVNGMDHATDIAGIAHGFENALLHSVTSVSPISSVPIADPTAPPPAKPGFWVGLMEELASIWHALFVK